MNKRALKTYMNGADKNHSKLRECCVKTDTGYLISDTYSIIKLNSNYDLPVVKDDYMLNRVFEIFNEQYEASFMIEKPTENIKIKDQYGLSVKHFNKINNVVKGNVYSILYIITNQDKKPIIKIENTKTGEVGYLLPTKGY